MYKSKNNNNSNINNSGLSFLDSEQNILPTPKISSLCEDFTF